MAKYAKNEIVKFIDKLQHDLGSDLSFVGDWATSWLERHAHEADEILGQIKAKDMPIPRQTIQWIRDAAKQVNEELSERSSWHDKKKLMQSSSDDLGATLGQQSKEELLNIKNTAHELALRLVNNYQYAKLHDYKAYNHLIEQCTLELDRRQKSAIEPLLKLAKKHLADKGELE